MSLISEDPGNKWKSCLPYPGTLQYVSDQYNTKEMFEKAVEENQFLLSDIPDRGRGNRCVKKL